MIRFKRLDAENFLAFKKLSLSLPPSGLILVNGKNRAGKSSLADAFSFALTGQCFRWKTPGGSFLQEKAIDSVIHSGGKGGCQVSLEFTRGDESFGISRYRGHPTFNNDLFLVSSVANDMRGVSNQQTQGKIESITGIDSQTMGLVDYLTNSSLDFMFQSEGNKSEILEHLMGVETFHKARDLVKEDVKKDEQTRVQQESALNLIQGRIGVLREYEEKYKSSLLLIQAALEAAEVDLGKEKATLEKKKSEVEVIANNLHALLLKERTSNWTKKKQIIEAGLKTFQSDLGSFRAVLSSLTTTTPERACSQCGRDFAGSDLEMVESKRNQRIASLVIQIEETETDISQSKLLLTSVEGRETTWLGLEAKYIELSRHLSGLDGEITKLVSNSDIARLAVEQSTTKEALRGIKIDIEKATEDKAELDIVHTKTKGLILDKRFWDWGFSPEGIRSFLLDTVRPILEREAQYYLRRLMDNITLSLLPTRELKTGKKREGFSVQVSSRSNVPFTNTSSSERKVISLAMALGMRRIRSMTRPENGLLILDECLDNLESEALHRVVNLLQEEAKDCLIFVTSHNQELKSFFHSAWEVVFDEHKGCSEVIVE